MFGPFRRFPFRGLALVAIGFLLASALAGGAPVFAGAAAGLGFVLLLPLLLFKMLFVFFLFGALLRFVGGRGRGWGPGWGPGRGPGGPWHRHGEESSSGRRDRWFDEERRDWEESLRRAREEVREYDNPFSPPPRGFEPPADRSED